MTGSLVKGAILTALLSMGLMGCSSSGGGGGGGAAAVTNVTISGAIAAATTHIESIPDSHGIVHEKEATMAVNLTNLEIYVIYTSGTTVGIKQATVDASTGAWSFDVPQGSQINAIVRNSVTAELVGPITFVDPNNKDLSGNSKESTVTSFKSGVTLGTIALSTSGKFQVDVSAPAIAAAQNTVVAAPASRIDFSGAWKIAKYDGTLPANAGYTTAVDCPDQNNCNGTPVGQDVYIMRLAGKKFNYSGGNCATYQSAHTGTCAVADGTVDTTVGRDAASIWNGASAIGACGYKIGFDQADALAGGQIDVETADLPAVAGHAMTYGHVTFSTSAGFGTDTAPNNLPWMWGGATSQYPMQDCFSVTKTGTGNKTYTLNVCSGTLHAGGTGYGASFSQNGCVTSTGKAVNVLNWTSLNALNTGSTCTQSSGAFAGITGMSSNTCTYSNVSASIASDANFTCTNTFGVYTNANLTTPSTDYIQTFDQVNAGALCSSISDNLQRFRCYGNAYYQHKTNSGCSKEYSFNWDATTAATFVQDDHRDRPAGQFLTNIVDYSADGNSFTLEDHQDDGVQVSGQNGSTFCGIDRSTLMKGTKVSDTKMLIALEQTVLLKSTTDNICVAAKNDSTSNGGNGSQLYQKFKDSQKTLFYLVR